MTIIIALAHEEGVTIGCDGFRTAGDDMILHDAMKWTINSEGLSVGLSGSPYLAEWVGELGFESGNADAYLFCDMLRKYFREDDRWPPEVKDGTMPYWDLNLLVTDKQKVWEIGGTLYPMEIPAGQPAAVGAGYKYALGAMHATQQALKQQVLSHIPKQEHPLIVVMDGLEAAVHYDIKCGGDLFVETLSP